MPYNIFELNIMIPHHSENPASNKWDQYGVRLARHEGLSIISFNMHGKTLNPLVNTALWKDLCAN